jgi:hypothetical protein
MAYNDQNENYKPLPFNVERDSIATRVNKEGLIEVVGKDKLRIDYTDSAKGVALLENSATNLIMYSEDFSQWLPIGSPTIESGYLSPSGNLDATKVTTGSNTTPLRKGTPNILNTEHTFSIYAKKGNYDKLGLDIGDETQPTFTLTDEWQRFEVTSTPTTYNHVDILLPFSSSGDFIYIWGAMLEENSVATSYIPTSGSTYQRQADVVNGSGNSEVFNDSEGVLFADIAALADDSTNRYISLSDGTSVNRIHIFYTSTNTIRGLKRPGDGSIDNDVNILLFNKAAYKYKSGDSAFWVNGFKVGVNTDATMPSGLNQLNFDKGDGTLDFYGKAKEIGYYDAVLTDSELEYLTSYRSLNELVTELNLNTL